MNLPFSKLLFFFVSPVGSIETGAPSHKPPLILPFFEFLHFSVSIVPLCEPPLILPFPPSPFFAVSAP